MKYTLAQLNFTVGDLQGNRDAIVQAWTQAAADCDVLVFSELALTGYYPHDLLLRPGFVEAQMQALQLLQEATTAWDGLLIVGAVWPNPGAGKPWQNVALALHRGQIIHTVAKQLLPTYDVFDEYRHFEPAGPQTVLRWRGHTLGLLVCEDAWNDDGAAYANNPVADAVAQGAEVLISLNASPANFGKQAERRRLFSALAQKYQRPLLFVNQVGGQDELIFDGASFALNAAGEPVAQAPAYAPALLAVDLAAAPQPWLALPDDAALAYQHAVLGLRDYARKCGFKQVVVGSSGGIDSALTLALAVDALGAEQVHALTLPSHFSSSGSVDDSETLCRNLGVHLHRLPIAGCYDLAMDLFRTTFGQEPSRLTHENLQARLRGLLLMQYSNHFGALLLTTGNKSELAVGYATLYGDMNGGLNLIGDLYKTEVYALARWINQRFGERIPPAIIDKAPSAELSPGQKDSDSLPEYPQLDAVLRLYIEPDDLDADARLQCEAWAAQLAPAEIARVLRLVDGAEFKRRQAAPIIRMHGRAFGRGRQLPIAQRYVNPEWRL